jgi:hypothetical protein
VCSNRKEKEKNEIARKKNKDAYAFDDDDDAVGRVFRLVGRRPSPKTNGAQRHRVYYIHGKGCCSGVVQQPPPVYIGRLSFVVICATYIHANNETTHEIDITWTAKRDTQS